jgi:Ca2+-binding EF-hand superfamily protein
MAHTTVDLDIAGDLKAKLGSAFAESLPNYVPEWQQNGTSRLEDERTKKLKKAFCEWDADGDGKITRDELKSVFSQLGVAKEKEIDAMMKEADRDGSGFIDLAEFVDWLYEGNTMGSWVWNYGEALLALFRAYDQSGGGTISYAEFEECHCLLQNCLRVNAVTDEQDHPIDALALDKGAAEAFANADEHKDQQIHYSEFVRYMVKMIDPKSITQEDYCEIVMRLANAMKKLLRGVRRAERGDIKEEESGVLRELVDDLAETLREFHETLQKSGDTVKSPQSWVDPPRGLSVEHLKAIHMMHMPVNMKLTQGFVFDVVVVPQRPENKEDTDERIWLGEVVRKVTYKSGVVRTEFPCLYIYDERSKAWKMLPQSHVERFEATLRSLDPEFGIFCILKCEADYGFQLSWSQVKNSLNTGKTMGWISELDIEKYCQHIEKTTRDKLGKRAKKQSKAMDDAEAAVQQFLETQLIQRPRVVMATLSKLGIVQVHSAWKEFITG